MEILPKIVCLQLNRLDYQNRELIKHKHKVLLEKELILDRFIYKNKEKNEKIRENVKQMRTQIKHLEESINEFTNFWDSDSDLRTIFEFMN